MQEVINRHKVELNKTMSALPRISNALRRQSVKPITTQTTKKSIQSKRGSVKSDLKMRAMNYSNASSPRKNMGKMQMADYFDEFD